MSSKKFWKLTFYEWSMWLLRIKLIKNRRKEDHEFIARLARRMMSVNAQVMGAKNVKEETLWPLEGEPEETPAIVSKEENEDKVKRALELRG